MTSSTTQDRRARAVVWIDERHATVASARGDRLAMAEIERGTEPETQYLAHVVHEMGERGCVMIVGPSTVRLALEREFVAINHRPDRLMSAPFGAGSGGGQVVDQLRRLVA